MDKLVAVIDSLRASIDVLSKHELGERLSWWAQIIIAIGGLATLLFTVYQIRLIAIESMKRTRHDKATFLYNLDTMFENESFTRNRVAFVSLRSEVEASIQSTQAYLDHDSKTEQFALKYCESLQDLKDTDIERYTQIMKLAGFFEAVQVFTIKGQIEKEDVLNLYRAAIVPYYIATYKHIQKRQTDERMPDLYENFLALGKDLHEKKEPIQA